MKPPAANLCASKPSNAHYDVYTSTQADVFNTVLWNTCGEITECARGNIALLLDGVWVIPLRSCGLLNDVGRAQCLFEGRLKEAVVRLDDLQRVTALAVVNSLRGWVDAPFMADGWHALSLAGRGDICVHTRVHLSPLGRLKFGLMGLFRV